MTDPYDLGARAVAGVIYRGRRDIAGDRVGWDDLPDSDKASCLALARPRGRRRGNPQVSSECCR